MYIIHIYTRDTVVENNATGSFVLVTCRDIRDKVGENKKGNFSDRVTFVEQKCLKT